MDSLHMAPQALLIWKVLLVIAAADQTVQVSKLHTLTLGSTIGVKDRVIFAVIITIVPHTFVKLIPSEILVCSNDDFI